MFFTIIQGHSFNIYAVSSGAYIHIFINASLIAILTFDMSLYKSYFLTDNDKSLPPLTPWEDPSPVLHRPSPSRIGKNNKNKICFQNPMGMVTADW